MLEIEEAAFQAWPADEVMELCGWRLRFMHGVTHRGNAVWPNAWRDGPPLGERIDAVERFSTARGIPPTFQLTSAACPEELDSALAARGYLIEAPVTVMTRKLSESFPLVDRGGQATVGSKPDPDWLAVAVDRGRYAGVGDVFLRLLERLGDRAGYALARSNGEPVAVGLGVADGPWLGIFGMLTVPGARRRGAASAVLRALSAWGTERGATRAYLQVEKANEGARKLYEAAGFSPSYEYWYRVKQEGS